MFQIYLNFTKIGCRCLTGSLGSLGSRKKPGDSGTSFAEMKYAFEKKLTHGIPGKSSNNPPQRSKIKDGNTWQYMAMENPRTRWMFQWYSMITSFMRIFPLPCFVWLPEDKHIKYQTSENKHTHCLSTHKHWDIARTNDGDTRNIWDVGFIFSLGWWSQDIISKYSWFITTLVVGRQW